MTFDLLLVGFGNVARRFVRLLDELRPVLTRDHTIDTRVVGIVTRSLGQTYSARGVDAATLAATASPDRPLGPLVPTTAFLRSALERSATAARDRRLVVVETTTLDIENGGPAVRHVREALRGGAHVMTSNKGPAAFAYRSLAALASASHRCFRFESAVMDGVPLFNLVRNGLPGASVTAVRGVVNSTTQYMLTAMERGDTFDQALSAMQRAGIAEANPALDVDGWDAAAKTAILANVLLGGSLKPRDITRQGLTSASGERARAARAVGRRLKLVASAERTRHGVNGDVRLMELPETDLLGALEASQNALILQTDVLGEIAVVQRGSGLTQTAYGLISDLVSIGRDWHEQRASPQRQTRAPRGRNPSPRAPRRKW